jgi:hypothetical protein
VTRRSALLLVVGTIVGASIGLMYALIFDILCSCQADLAGRCSCSHDELFGWQPGSLAVPLWTVIGAIGGGIVGRTLGWITERNPVPDHRVRR